ncbi:carbamoyltransferase HypF [Thermogladius sp. 4427co]|uniref:carbamoyltransferase HypF n=1 Tax=Thermogladius sp. 4427co TaxID=3450718 RepID=UPI003F7B2379
MRAKRIIVIGLVQGVGFRPFVDRLARKLGVKGYVRNIGGSEVEIWVEGPPDIVEEFVRRLELEKPPPAFLEEIRVEEVTPVGFTGFGIKPSASDFKARSNIPPDLAMCHDCLLEVLNPGDRRYRYPFNSCAWCGPRYSMIHRVPYDRENTSMGKYHLCGDCLREYNDPDNLRRYHAQGISCPRDGPRLSLQDHKGSVIDAEKPIETAAKLIEEGYIIAVKGIGGYHLAALATDDDVVAKLRARKKRPSKPFAIMGIDTIVLRRLVYMSDEDEELLNSPQAPILLLPKREDSPVSSLVSPGLSHEGVFVAYSPLHYLLLKETKDKFLIMTSGNLSGEPMCRNEECAFKELGGIADYFLVHDREIVHRVDDSVVRKTRGRYVLLRRSRGYAPLWIRLPGRFKQDVVAFGSDLNNTIALGFEDKIVVSPYIGDLDEAKALRDLVGELDFLVRSFRVDTRNAIVVSDKHPGYMSSKIAGEFSAAHNLRHVRIQHHLAHVLSVAGDHGLTGGRVIGLAIDGLGWGDDDTIWGGEVLLVDLDNGSYQRLGSIRPLPLTSDQDTLKPARLLAGYLSLRKQSVEDVARLLRDRGFSEKEIRECLVSYKLVARGFYKPASSTGRLIDIASILIGASRERTYDGEPAIRLEALAFRGGLVDPPEVKLVSENGLLLVDSWRLIDWLIEDNSEDKASLARTFLVTLGEAFGRLVTEIAKGRDVRSEILVSGGAAVNEFIIEGLEKTLAGSNFSILMPRRIPPNDGGISFGQAYYVLLASAV